MYQSPRDDTTATACRTRRRRGLPVWLAAALVFGGMAPTPSHALPASTYVVAPGGSDAGSGTVTDPFATLQHGFAFLRPGDTLLVRGGVYDERIMNPEIERGLPGTAITVAAFPGEIPIIRGLLWLRDADFWSIRGINVTWSERNQPSEHMVKFTDGIGWSFADAQVWDAHSYAAILVAGHPSEWHLQGLYVHDTAPTHGANQDHLLYVNGFGGGIVEGCVFAHSPNGQAIKIGTPSPTTIPVGTVLIRNNTMFDNRGPSNVQLAWSASGVELVRNILVGPAAGRANVTAYQLSGTGNVVADNVGWDSTAVVAGDAPAVASARNFSADPAFANPAAGDYTPTNPAVRGYGAGGF